MPSLNKRRKKQVCTRVWKNAGDSRDSKQKGKESKVFDLGGGGVWGGGKFRPLEFARVRGREGKEISKQAEWQEIKSLACTRSSKVKGRGRW